mmetsp:Transcript_14958/g.30141  ORF Transcript_14958/g.30141 Transcript_14958/m.30141 type:complete len:161 (+) Transcript_14958:158-640(+)
MRTYHLSILPLVLLSNTAVSAFPAAAAAAGAATTNPTGRPLSILDNNFYNAASSRRTSSNHSSSGRNGDARNPSRIRPSVVTNPIAIRGGAAAAAAAAASSTSLAAVPPWVEACGLAAPIASVFVSLSPLPTVNKIRKDKSVGDLPLLPYSSLVANWYVV